MDELESIDKLRGIICDVNVDELSANIQQPIGTGREARVSPAWVDSWQRAAERALDEIEREVADRYMELPVDADGVPIHVGERMRLDNGHEGEVWLIGAFDIMMSDHTCFDWATSHHVKPRTLEDVLRDVVTLCANTWKDEKSAFKFYDVDNVMESGNIADFADEIRELLEVDE